MKQVSMNNELAEAAREKKDEGPKWTASASDDDVKSPIRDFILRSNRKLKKKAREEIKVETRNLSPSTG